MWIAVDSNEARSGLADLLRETWDQVTVRRLGAGDVLIGRQVLVERKTADDFAASLRSGRLFGQATRLARAAERPVVIREGAPGAVEQLVPPGQLRGAMLALTTGFRIPVLTTTDLNETAQLLSPDYA